jgi:hypothetical protein
VDGIDVTCSAHGEDKKRVQNCNRRTCREESRWEDNIKMDINQIGYDGFGWIHVVQNRMHWWVLLYMMITV